MAEEMMMPEMEGMADAAGGADAATVGESATPFFVCFCF